MSDSFSIRIDYDKVLLVLFYLYAFSMPFELILDIEFGIDTIFKPFRVLSLLIIGVYGLKILRQGIYLKSDYHHDLALYGVFIYGLLISLFRMMDGIFQFGLFLNDTFQVGLHVATFFIFKATHFRTEQMMWIMRCFVFGIALNSLYIFYDFFIFGHHGRQSGYTDNPNYSSLGLVAAMTYLLLRLDRIKKFWYQVLFSLVFLFFLYIFIIVGSRTGLVIFLLSNVFLFAFYSFRRKLALSFLVGVFVLMLLPEQLERVSIGGGPLVLFTRIHKNLESGEEDVRFIIWRGVFRALETEGYAGMGIGQFKANFPHYFNEEYHKLVLDMVNYGYYLSTHNDYLALLTDYGLPALLCYLVFLYVAFRKIFRRLLLQETDPQRRFLYQLNFILFVGLTVFGLAAENFQHQLYWFLLAFTTSKAAFENEPQALASEGALSPAT